MIFLHLGFAWIKVGSFVTKEKVILSDEMLLLKRKQFHILD